MEDNDASTTQLVSSSRLALRNFSSQWFLIPQGSGIIAVVLHQLDYQFRGLAILSQIFWVFTIVTLVGSVAVYLLRTIVWREHTAHQLRYTAQEASGLASISITFTTIIQMIALNLVTTWSPGWGVAAYALWWINAGMAAVACIGIPYVNAHFNSPGIEVVPLNVLLPPIAALTVAAGGGVVCMYGKLDASHTLPVIIVSYLFIGIGFLYSILVDAVILAQLLTQGRGPSKESTYQLMILAGPPGQGSFALQILGSVITKLHVFAQYDTSSFISLSGGSIIGPTSEFLGLLIWGYGIFWWGFACIAILHYLFANPKELFNRQIVLFAWALVFPWGVYTNAAVELGVVLNSRAFNVWSTVLAILLVVIWLGNMAMTVTSLVDGRVLGLDRGWRARYSIGATTSQNEKDGRDEGAGERDSRGESHSAESVTNGLRQRHGT